MIHAILIGDVSHALETLLAVSALLLIMLCCAGRWRTSSGRGWSPVRAIPAARLFLPPLQTQLSMLNLDFAPAGEAAADMPAPLEPDVMVIRTDASEAPEPPEPPAAPEPPLNGE